MTGCPTSTRRLPVAAALAFALAGAPESWATDSATAKRPAVVPVTSCADDGSPGTLRSAVGLASSGDTVDLGGLSCSTITLGNGAIESNVDDLRIAGPGASRLTIDAQHASRAFLHGGAGTLTVARVTVANGSYTPIFGGAYGGGCVASTGSVLMVDAVATGCVATASGPIKGGAVFVFGGVELYGSTITGSSAISLAGATGPAALGGAIFAYRDISLHHSVVSGNGVSAPSGFVYGGALRSEHLIRIKFSSVRNNRATTDAETDPHGFGGGISSLGASVFYSTFEGNFADASGAIDVRAHPYTTVVENSTISGNHARILGGAMLADNDLVIQNCTIAFNKSGPAGGGGLVVYGSYIAFQSTILADNEPSGPIAAADLDGTSGVLGGTSLIQVSGLPVPPDTIALDPELAPLAANGGPTRTHALSATSPAIDRGTDTWEPFDQRGRGFPRKIGAAVDIGAYERDTDTIFRDGFDAML